MLLATAHWDGYTVFSVISGVLLVLATFMPGLKPGNRITSLLVGIGMAAYGIYVANQTSGTYFFPVYIFVVPVLAVVMIIKALAGPGTRRPRAGRPAGGPVTRPLAANQPVANASYAAAPVANPNVTGPFPTAVNPAVGVRPPAPSVGAAPVMPGAPVLQPPATPASDGAIPPLPAYPVPGQKIVIELSDLEDA